jgi:phage-related holin
MKNKELKSIIKLILIAGIVLCGIAQLLPWGRFELGMVDIPDELPSFLSGLNINYYHWGGWQISPKLPGVQEWFLAPTNFSGISASPEIYGFAFGTLFLYFIIPLAIISFITGIVAYKKIGKKVSKNSLHASLSSAAAILFFIVYMQLTLLNNLPNIEKSPGVSATYMWLPGFYLMILSAILFFISYMLIQKMYKDKGVKTEIKNNKPKETKNI